MQTTARTVEQAKDAALDQLGVDEQDAEFEVLEEPRPGLFGRLRGEARVRARVAPKPAPPKQERRDKRRRSGRGRGDGDGGQAPADRTGGARNRPRGDRADGGARSSSRPERNERPERGAKTEQGERAPRPEEDRSMQEPVTVQAQADIMADFLEGLVGAFGLDGTVNRREVDDETIELDVEGDDLGLLIGPKGQTLVAVQELARTAAQRKAPGPHQGRVRVDVGGYRQRRREALERFTQQLAEDVQRSGQQKALEPMGAADRKVVHDTVNLIDGVSTVSSGEEPRRRVIIVPGD